MFARLWMVLRDTGVPSFLLMQGLAVLASGVWVGRSAGSSMYSAVFSLGAVIGAILLGIVLRLPRFLLQWGQIHLLSDGWLMAYGALLGGLLGVGLLAKRRGDSVAEKLDRAAPALGLLIAFGRLGCFLAGCDYGSRTDLPWGVAYPAGYPAYARGPIHPVQLYESALGVGMAMLGVNINKRTHNERGRAVMLVMALYAAGRFGLEWLRGDERAMMGGLSLAQWISVAVLFGVTSVWAGK